jgi:TRAP-type C4-dicarboxylate transport system permease large subunit
MQRTNYTLLSVITIVLFFFSSCQAIGDIFKAGVWSGLLLVAAVIAIIIFIISRFRK